MYFIYIYIYIWVISTRPILCRKYIFKWSIFRCHVSLPECRYICLYSTSCGTSFPTATKTAFHSYSSFFIDVHCYLRACSWYSWNVRMIILLKKRSIELCVLPFQLLVSQGHQKMDLQINLSWLVNLPPPLTYTPQKSGFNIGPTYEIFPLNRIGSPHLTSWTMLDVKHVTWKPEQSTGYVLARCRFAGEQQQQQ